MPAIPDSKDRVVFAVGFLTVLVTVVISGYKEFLSNINFILLFYPISLFDLLVWASIILFLSVYATALDNLRGCNIRFFHLKILNKCSFIADFLYFVSIFLLPITFLVGYLASKSIFLVSHVLIFLSNRISYHLALNNTSLGGISFSHQFTDYISIISSAIASIGTVIVYIISYTHIKKER